MYYSHSKIHFSWKTKKLSKSIELSFNPQWFNYKSIRNHPVDTKWVFVLLGISLFYSHRERWSGE